MSRWWSALLTVSLALVAGAPALAQEETLPEQVAPPADELGRTSYALGANIGDNLRRQGVKLDSAQLTAGLLTALAGQKLLLSDEEIASLLGALEKQMRAAHAERGRAMGDSNLSEGQAFLAANAKKEGVKSTKSGLQFKVLRVGEGRIPKRTDTVKTHYEGRLIDGTVFDSSYTRGEPATFPVQGVIPGWTEALQLMPVGSKWQLFIPAELAYGERGAGGVIGPNATLIFDIELLSIE